MQTLAVGPDVDPRVTDALGTCLREAEIALSTSGIPSARLEAESLACHFLSLRRVDLLIRPEQPISGEQKRRLMSAVARRGAGEPIQYLIGEVTFCGLPLQVGPGVFIPRPETEFIVEAAHELRPTRILDLCTGSGALAIALANQFPAASVTAIDASEMALSFARMNGQRHRADVTFLHGDLFGPLASTAPPFDLIVSNPPYVAMADAPTLPTEVIDHEPHAALFAGEDGTQCYRRIFDKVGEHLTSDGTVLLEMGYGQAAWLKSHLAATWQVTFLPDFSGIDRVAICRRRV
jgi:release factor glutamine methyltransferase